MGYYWKSLRTGLSLLDLSGRQRCIAIAALSAIQSLLDGLGLGIVLVAMRVALEPRTLNTVPALRRAAEAVALHTQGQLTVALFGGAALFYLLKAAYGIWVSALIKDFVWSERDRLNALLLHNFMQWDYWRLFGSSAAILQKNVSAVEHVAKYFLIPLIMFFAEFTALAIIVIALALIQPILLVGILPLAATAAVTAYAARRYTRSLEKDFQLTVAGLLSAANEIFGSARDIKLYNAQKYFGKRADQQVAKNSEIQKRVTFAIELPRVVMETVLVLALCGAMMGLVLSGADLTVVLPFTATLVVAMIRLLPAANRMLLSLNLIRFGVPALNDVAEAIAVPVDRAPHSGKLPPSPTLREIRISGITFRYPNSESLALDGIDMQIQRGNLIAFVGGSGSGKTTMANLLLGLLTPTSGVITVDGRPIAQHVAAWRSKVAFVPQDVFLLDDTLRRNIAFGQDDADIDETALYRALQLAQLGSLADELQEGLDTRIGDRGGRLSGGQRLRVAIARALYFGREVLVLDEATSALDPRTEREITAAIDGLRGKVTVIVVAHRMSTVQQCDRLYVFKKGRIAETGTFESLSKESMEFRSLIGSAGERPASP